MSIARGPISSKPSIGFMRVTSLRIRRRAAFSSLRDGMARSTSRSTAWQRFSKIVGWVERLRETHHPKQDRDGFRFALPILRSLRQNELILAVPLAQQILREI